MDDATLLEALIGKYMRLHRELAEAHAAGHWRGGLVDRLADEIDEAKRALAQARPVDEQTDDVLPGFDAATLGSRSAA